MSHHCWYDDCILCSPKVVVFGVLGLFPPLNLLLLGILEVCGQPWERVQGLVQCMVLKVSVNGVWLISVSCVLACCVVMYGLSFCGRQGNATFAPIRAQGTLYLTC